jgi:hypothetical protein
VIADVVLKVEALKTVSPEPFKSLADLQSIDLKVDVFL